MQYFSFASYISSAINVAYLVLYSKKRLALEIECIFRGRQLNWIRLRIVLHTFSYAHITYTYAHVLCAWFPYKNCSNLLAFHTHETVSRPSAAPCKCELMLSASTHSPWRPRTHTHTYIETEHTMPKASRLELRALSGKYLTERRLPIHLAVSFNLRESEQERQQ